MDFHLNHLGSIPSGRLVFGPKRKELKRANDRGSYCLLVIWNHENIFPNQICWGIRANYLNWVLDIQSQIIFFLLRSLFLFMLPPAASEEISGFTWPHLQALDLLCWTIDREILQPQVRNFLSTELNEWRSLFIQKCGWKSFLKWPCFWLNDAVI